MGERPAVHERSVLESVTEIRAQAVQAEQTGDPANVAQHEEALAAAVESLFAVAEAYPALKADAGFREPQAELVATEDNIAFSRTLFNDTATAYRDAVQGVPLVLLARPPRVRAARVSSRPSPGERQAPLPDTPLQADRPPGGQR